MPFSISRRFHVPSFSLRHFAKTFGDGHADRNSDAFASPADERWYQLRLTDPRACRMVGAGVA